MKTQSLKNKLKSGLAASAIILSTIIGTTIKAEAQTPVKNVVENRVNELLPMQHLQHVHCMQQPVKNAVENPVEKRLKKPQSEYLMVA